MSNATKYLTISSYFASEGASSARWTCSNVESEIQNQFEFGLQRVLDGIETLLRGRDPWR